MSLLSFKRELDRTRYGLTMLGLFSLLAILYYVLFNVRLTRTDHHTVMLLVAAGQWFWMSTLASRAHTLQRSNRIALWAWVPYANVYVTLLLGLQNATLPGKEEKALPKSWYIAALVVPVLIFAYFFFTADAFQSDRHFLKWVIGIGLVGAFLYGAGSGNTSSSSDEKRSNKPNDLFAGGNKPQPTAPAEKKLAGHYRYNEGGWRDFNIDVYSDGDTFTAVANGRPLKAASFAALEPLIYQAYANEKRFKMISVRQY